MTASRAGVPLYKPGMLVQTVEQRRAASTGFVYSGFRAPNLFGRVTVDARFRHADFVDKIFDGVGEAPEQLIYSEGRSSIDNPLMDVHFGFQFVRHEWTLRVIAPQSYPVSASRWLPGLVFCLGLLLSAPPAMALRRSRSLAERLTNTFVFAKKPKSN